MWKSFTEYWYLLKAMNLSYTWKKGDLQYSVIATYFHGKLFCDLAELNIFMMKSSHNYVNIDILSTVHFSHDNFHELTYAREKTEN